MFCYVTRFDSWMEKRSSDSQFESGFDSHNLNHKTDENITSFILHVCMVKLNIKNKCYVIYKLLDI